MGYYFFGLKFVAIAWGCSEGVLFLPLLSDFVCLLIGSFCWAGLPRRSALLMPRKKKDYVMMGFTELRNAGGKMGFK
jgi:hypothetical protein